MRIRKVRAPEPTAEQIIDCQQKKIRIFRDALLTISDRHEKLLAEFERTTGRKWVPPVDEPTQSIIDQINEGGHANG